MTSRRSSFTLTCTQPWPSTSSTMESPSRSAFMAASTSSPRSSQPTTRTVATATTAAGAAAATHRRSRTNDDSALLLRRSRNGHDSKDSQHVPTDEKRLLAGEMQQQQQQSPTRAVASANSTRLKLSLLFVIWTLFTMISVYAAKIYLSRGGSIILLAFTSHAIGASPCLVHAIRCEEWRLSRIYVRDITLAAVFNACNSLLTNYSLVQSSVHTVYALKGLEPCMTALLVCLIAGQLPSPIETIMTLILGFATVTTARSSSDVGLSAYMAGLMSVLVVSSRSVLLKQALSQHRQTPTQVFTAVNAVSAIICLRFVRTSDIYDLTVTSNPRTHLALIVSALASLAYYFSSLLFLSMVRPETHSLCNVTKRLLVSLPSTGLTLPAGGSFTHAISLAMLHIGSFSWAVVPTRLRRPAPKRALPTAILPAIGLGLAALYTTHFIIGVAPSQVASMSPSAALDEAPRPRPLSSHLLHARYDVDSRLQQADVRIGRIHRMIDTGNIGDLYSSPFHYFAQLNSTGHQIQADMEEPGTVNAGARSDVVILGGGGLLQTMDSWDHKIEKILNEKATAAHRKKNAVIAWAVGFNNQRDLSTEGTRGALYPSRPYLPKFKLLGLRDRVPGYRWVPCVTAMFQGFDYTYPVKRPIGWFQHSGSQFGFEDSLGLGPDDFMTNAAMDFNATVAFLGSSEVVLTTSYHGLYWATLLGKKVIVLEALSRKFDLFPWPPTFFSGNLTLDISRARSYPNALQEARDANLAFWEDVKEILYDVADVSPPESASD